MTSVADCVRMEEENLVNYVVKSEMDVKEGEIK